MKLVPTAGGASPTTSHEQGDHHMEDTGDGLEWEDLMPDINRQTDTTNMIWKLVDRQTGAENGALLVLRHREPGRPQVLAGADATACPVMVLGDGPTRGPGGMSFSGSIRRAGGGVLSSPHGSEALVALDVRLPTAGRGPRR